MRLLTWWQGALLLGVFPLLHWWLSGKPLAVSGRVTALIDWARRPPVAPDALVPGAAGDDEELLAALAEATAAEFGPLSDAQPAVPSEEVTALAPRAEATALPPLAEATALPPLPAPAPLPPPPTRQPVWYNVVFFGGLLLGGSLSALWRGDLHLRGPEASFTRLFGGGSTRAALVLLGGGFLVGLGTRMAGGCTSGHGLCGVSRLQRGSLLSTAAFFGAAVLASLALEALVRR